MSEVDLLSTSRAEDAGYLALGDVAVATRSIGADYRLVGGHMVGLLVAIHRVADIPARETADADLGADFAVVGDGRLLDALTGLGYTRPESANRFVRNESKDLAPTIDVLAPSFTGRHRPNRQHGVLVVDEIPGLALALAQPPVQVSVRATLTDGRAVVADVRLPGPLPALCMKLLAYGSRLERKDAEDVWRMLAVCRVARVGPGDWRPGGSLGDAARVLEQFKRISGPVRSISDDRVTQTRVRALAAAVGPQPAS